MLLNPFDQDAFSLYSLTSGINRLPNKYDRLGQMGIFANRPVRSRTIFVEEKNGVLNLLQTQPPGAPGTMNKSSKRKIRSFVIPHIPHDDEILPAEYMGVREFGTEDQLMTLNRVMADHLQEMKDKHDITLEHLRCGALKGIILDADGTEIYNLFTEFGITQKSIDFAFSADSTDVRAVCFNLSRHIEDNLQGEVMSYVHALCSPEFFDALTGHANVREAFLYQQAATLRDDIRKRFEFGGIVWEEYRGKASDREGTSRLFIPANEAVAFPMGTMDTFETAIAPADFLETANTFGKPYYAKIEPRKFNRGVDIHTQSNPLPICKRPEVLVKLTKS
jgi:hypothetical protein